MERTTENEMTSGFTWVFIRSRFCRALKKYQYSGQFHIQYTMLYKESRTIIPAIVLAPLEHSSR